jgi:hypothetical protein
VTNHRTHDLLPWYVNKTLTPDELREVEAHLAECDACTRELGVLEKIDAEVARHGAAFFETHPAPDELVAWIEPGETALDPARRAALSKHVALCASCAEEAGWIRGEAAAGAAVATGAAVRPFRGPSARWLAAAAGLFVAAVGIGLLVRSRDGAAASEVISVHFVPATQRDGAVPEVDLAEAADAVHLLFEVDLAPEAFPVSLRIHGPRGVVLSSDRVAGSTLLRGRFLFVRLRRDELPPGAYRAEVRSIPLPAQFIEFAFAIEK